MANDSQLQFSGNISIEKVLITTPKGFYQDITNQITGIQLFEDIFAPFITGTLVVRDSLDMINAMPFIGEEYLELKMSTPSINKGNIDSKFYIHKMTDRQPTGDKGFIYELHFISQEVLIDINKKISKSFSGKCSDIAQELLTSIDHGFQLKNVVIEPTRNDTKYTSNFWSPIKNINILSDTSINTNGSPSYLFFQDRYNYNFVSLESLYRTEVYQEFFYDNYVRDVVADGKATRNITEDYKRISSFNIPVAYDYINRTTNGMYGSRLFTYDIVTKRYINKNFDMFEAFPNQYHLNNYPISSSKSTYRYNALQINMSKYSESYSGFGDVTNADSIQSRVSLMEQIHANKIEIVVPGRLDYTVGLRIAVTFYKSEPTTNRDTGFVDEVFSGSYLISAINHFINRSSHECTMEIVKESFIRDLDKV